jgi:hypothetical protein
MFEVDWAQFLAQYQDHLAPRLDTYEQAIYLYLVRHSRLVGLADVVVGFKSARTRMACGVGHAGQPMSENSVYLKLASLQQKGLITVLATTHSGRRIQVAMPCEVPGAIPGPPEAATEADLETMDFFNDPLCRQMLLEREGFRCFYTLEVLDKETFAVEHVVSRPHGSNGYRNCVAPSRKANNLKGSTSAEDFFRRLYREGYLSPSEFEERMAKLALLTAGELKPLLPSKST